MTSGPTMAGGPKVVATVLVHNNGAGTTEVLRRLAAQSVLPAAVIVLDNGSARPIRCQPLLATSADADPHTPRIPVELVRSAENIGVGGGHNLAFRTAFESFGADAVWCLEHDTFPDADCLEELLDARATLGDGSILASTLTRNNYERQPTPRTTSTTETRSFTFNSIWIDRSVWQRLGPIREDFFVDLEDRDYADRAHAQHVKIFNAERSIAIHANKGGQRELGSISPDRLYYSVRNHLARTATTRGARWRAVARGGVTAAGELITPRRGWPYATARWQAARDGTSERLGRRGTAMPTVQVERRSL